MAVLYILIAVILSVTIEAVRIISQHGKVVNINKVVTYCIGAVLFAVVLTIEQQDHFWAVCLLGLNYMFCRATIYSPILNKARGKDLWYTDSDPDKMLGRWMLKNNVQLQLVVAVSGVAWAATSILYLIFFE